MDNKDVTTIAGDKTQVVEQDSANIQNLIYVIRGKQVMLDSDLAQLYQIETRTLNQSVKRNIKRFPERYRFQLTGEEYEDLKSQIVISSTDDGNHGGRRKLPFAFTEQGIAMLSSVLKSDVAIQINIRIMDTFVDIRKYMANNVLLYEKVNNIELKQLEFQKSTDEKFDKVFRYIEDHSEDEQKIFFDGQIYDAFSLIITLIQKARKEIILVDGYVDVGTLNLLAKKNKGVTVMVYTYVSSKLSNTDIDNFNSQYPTLLVKRTQIFHDRFLVIDGHTVYHIGASIKDAGKKCFGVSLWQDSNMVADLLNRLKTI